MNTEMNEQTDILLVKYMLGEATPEEQQQVQQWLNQSTANAQYYQQLETIWQQSKKLEAQSSIQEEEAWKRFQQKRVAGGFESAPPVVMLPARQPRRRLYIAAAAAIAILAAGSWLLVLNNQWPGSNMQELAADNNVLSDTLPDGSIVTLNRHAHIRYAKTFLTNATREIELEGEAFFDIAPNRNKPFIINAGDVSISVIGTSFNVKSNKKTTEVIVETGSVQVTYNSKTVQLAKKEKAILTRNNRQLSKQEDNSELHNYYRTGKFICKKTPLYRLVDVLNEAYNTNITIADSATGNQTLTTSFNQESLDTVLSIVSQTLKIQVVKQNNQIILK